MANVIFDWSPVEPAHEMSVQLHDDLRSIYTVLKERFQVAVDAVFDGVARRIGYVVITTVPVKLEVQKGGELKFAGMGAEHLKGTLFDEGFAKALKDLTEKPVKGVSVGSYTLPLLWVDALKVKLRLDWVEPAHFRKPAFAEYRQRRIVWEAHEPVHWFHPGSRLAPAEAVLITVLDEVYPELGLANQVAAMKHGPRYQVGPGVREPAHVGRFVGPEVLEPAHWHVGPGVREPAHFRPFERFESPEAAVELIQQLASMLRRYGF